jgi:hypothetical protein
MAAKRFELFLAIRIGCRDVLLLQQRDQPQKLLPSPKQFLPHRRPHLRQRCIHGRCLRLKKLLDACLLNAEP